VTTRADGSGRPPDSASFEPARLGGRRPGRPPVLGFAFVMVLGVVVAAGIGGRLSPGSFPEGGDELAAASASPVVETGTPDPDRFGSAGLPAFPADTGPIYTSPPGPMQVQAKRHPATIFIHGDVDAARITWVFVSVLDDIGRVAGWTSVSVPGAAGPNTNGGPALRFDVELAIPADFDGRLFVRAQAYDTDGKMVASSSVAVPAP
jgi:hypothetical protein